MLLEAPGEQVKLACEAVLRHHLLFQMGQAVYQHHAGLGGPLLGGLQKAVVGQPLGNALVPSDVIGGVVNLVKLHHLQGSVPPDHFQNAVIPLVPREMRGKPILSPVIVSLYQPHRWLHRPEQPVQHVNGLFALLLCHASLPFPHFDPHSTAGVRILYSLKIGAIMIDKI